MTERIWKSAQIYALVGAYPTTLLIGIPAYFILRRHFAGNLVNCLVSGAIVAALPWLVLGLLPSGEGFNASVDGYATVIDGRRTAYGWLLQAGVILQIAAVGLLGGLVFWSAVALRLPAKLR